MEARTNPFLIDDENTTQRAQRFILQHIVRQDGLHHRSLEIHLGRKSLNGGETEGGNEGQKSKRGGRRRIASFKSLRSSWTDLG